jgi:hypothetical protein
MKLATTKNTKHTKNFVCFTFFMVPTWASFYAFFQQTALEERGSPAENSHLCDTNTY